MRRHDSLIPLTHDHHHVLREVRHLKRESGGDDEARSAQTNEFLAFFRSAGIEHFRQEEESVFPMAIGFEEARPLIAKVMVEHLEIHAMINDLAAEVAVGIPRQETMASLASKVAAHVRFEEKVLFPLIERFVDPPRLDAMAVAGYARS